MYGNARREGRHSQLGAVVVPDDVLETWQVGSNLGDAGKKFVVHDNSTRLRLCKKILQEVAAI